MKRPILSLCLLSLLACGAGCAVRDISPIVGVFQTGWWTDVGRPEYLADYAAKGHTLVQANGAGSFTSPEQRAVIQTYLDEAQKQGIKVILSMTRRRNTPYGIPVREFVDTITAFRNHPALSAWYIGDEPESYDAEDGNREDDWALSHGYLATDPGYYDLAKKADLNHPMLISFSQIFNPLDAYFAKVARFFDVTDLIGMHSYPFWTPDEEFVGYDSRTQYDKWKYMLEKTIAYEKPGFVATIQGFGKNPYNGVYRDPTYAEYRHQIFSAIVLGIDRVLFWYDKWATPAMKDLVNRMVGQIREIGPQMNNGVTNDPRIEVSVSDRDQLVYRYGVAGDRHVILAVNIANRTKLSGATLSNVRFGLPSGMYRTEITVLDENRTLPIIDSSFADTLAPFSVHIYIF